MDGEGYRDKLHIFPVGFTAESRAGEGATFVSCITEGPSFRVLLRLDDEEGEPQVIHSFLTYLLAAAIGNELDHQFKWVVGSMSTSSIVPRGVFSAAVNKDAVQELARADSPEAVWEKVVQLQDRALERSPEGAEESISKVLRAAPPLGSLSGIRRSVAHVL